MLDNTKDIVIALIENKQIANTANVETNIEQVKNAIKDIYEQLKKCKAGE